MTNEAAAFESGDLLIASTEVEQKELDFRKGIRGVCRILHCGPDFAIKREIRTGEEGLVVGLGRDPLDGTIYVTNPQRSSVLRIGADGQMQPGPAFLPSRRYGNLVFRPDGSALIGVHSRYSDAPDDGWGDGKLVLFDPRAGTCEFFDVAIDGGRGGRHCVSNLALAPDGRTVYYVSEAGRRLGRYDVAARRQLEPFLVFDADDRRGTYGVAVRPSGEVLLAIGVGLERYAPDATLLEKYELPDMRGWTRARLALDDRHLYVGNFLEGLLQKREIDGGRVVQELDVRRKGSLTSVLEIP